jgi:hypothetical protein
LAVLQPRPTMARSAVKNRRMMMRLDFVVIDVFGW